MEGKITQIYVENMQTEKIILSFFFQNVRKHKRYILPKKTLSKGVVRSALTTPLDNVFFWQNIALK